MKILAINFATNVEATVRFFEALGLNRNQPIDPIWTEMSTGGGTLAVHREHGQDNQLKTGLEVSLVAEKPLEAIQADLVAAGFEPGRIVDEDFGRSLRVLDPDGNEMQINDH